MVGVGNYRRWSLRAQVEFGTFGLLDLVVGKEKRPKESEGKEKQDI